jgi:serine/threonine protein kinase
MLFNAILKGNERPAQPLEGSTAYTHYGTTDDIWKMIEDCLVSDPNKRPSARDILKRPFMAGSKS